MFSVSVGQKRLLAMLLMEVAELLSRPAAPPPPSPAAARPVVAILVATLTLPLLSREMLT